jgi:membrane protein DedA with SNARE-associated domain
VSPQGAGGLARSGGALYFDSVSICVTRRHIPLAVLSIGATVVVCILIVQHREFINEIAHWGYVGCFVVNTLASGTLVLPGMGAVLTFTLGGVLHPAVVGVVAGLGEATGAVGAYLTGYGGRGLVAADPFNGRFSAFIERHGCKAMFIMAALINPVYYPFAVWMGVLRVHMKKFFFYTLLGRTVKNLVLAYLGYYGIRTVLHWFGVIV